MRGDPQVAGLRAARPKDNFRASSIDGIPVLVADGNVTNRFLMKSYLEGSGAMVRYASCGLEALECFEAEPAEVVLMDISMPRMMDTRRPAGFALSRRSGGPPAASSPL